MGPQFSTWTVTGAWRMGLSGLMVFLGVGLVSLTGCGDFETAVGGAGGDAVELVLPDRSQDLKRVAAAEQVSRADLRRIDHGERGGKDRRGKPVDAEAWEGRRRIATFEPSGDARRGDWGNDDDGAAWAGWDRLPEDFAEGPDSNPEQFGAEARRDAPLPEDCPVCGRETGFLGAPVLSGALSADKSVLLTWEAVDGAEYYLVRALATGYDDLDCAPSEFLWRTDLTGLSVHLPENQQYKFTVEARRERPKARSVRSNAVVIDL